MPQDPYGLGWEPLTTQTNKNDPYGLGWEPIQTSTTPQPNYQPPPSSYQPPQPIDTRFANPPIPQKEPGFFEQQFTWPNAVRMGLSTAGDYLGAAGGVLFPPAAPLIYGGVSFLGGAGGELAGQLMEGKSPNWGSIGTEGALNLMPGPNIPGRGALASDIAKFGIKSAGYGAAQGLVGSVPRHIAETGQWEMPSVGEIAGQTAVGGLAGGVTGVGLAGGHQLLSKMMPSTPATPNIKLPEQDINPNLDSANVIPPSSPVPQQGPSVVTIRDYSQVPYWKERGYVIVPGMKSSDGYQQMVPGNVSAMFKDSKIKPTELNNDQDVLNLMDQMRTEPVPPQPTSPYTRENIPGALGEGYLPENTTEVKIPNDEVDGPFIANMRESGFQIADKNPTHTIFKPIDPNMHATEPPLSPGLDELFDKLRASIGEEPKDVMNMEGPPEDIAMRERRVREILSGEQTGRVAPFEPYRNKQVYDIADELHNLLKDPNADDAHVTTLMEELTNKVHGETDPAIAADNVRQLHDYANNPHNNDDQGELLGSLYNEARDKANQLNGQTGLPGAGMGVIRPMEELRREFVPNPPPPPESPKLRLVPPLEGVPNEGGLDIGPLRQRNLMGERPAFEGSEPLFPEPRGVSEAYDPSRDPTGWLPGQGSTIPSSASKPMVERANILRQEQDAAYRAGDTKKAVDLGQQIDEIETLIGRTGTRDINRLMRRGISEAKRPYDPTVGGDAYQRQQGTWEEALNTSSHEELMQMGKTLNANLDRIKQVIADNGGYAPGQYKRNILATEEKMRQIDEAIIRKQQEERRGVSEAKAPEETIRMEVGGREEMLRNMQGTYAEHGGRVANKELLQNAIDATPTGGTVSVEVSHANGTITVKDEGPGLPIDMIRNEYVTLTGSGKRGVGAASGRKSIGEMGVGKATYLLGVDSFHVKTVANEPDGTTWKYEFKGNADSMIGKTTDGKDVPPVSIKKTQVKNGTPTGTEVTIHDADPENLKAAVNYLKTFADYSDSPVHVALKSDVAPGGYSWDVLSQTVNPRTTAVGQHIHSGTAPGGDYQMFVPTAAQWSERRYTTAILTARGMFQGAQEVDMGAKGNLPDRIVVNIEPTVTAQQAKLYPLTSPTRERMKDPFKNEIEKQVKTHLADAAEKARQDDLKQAYANLQPDPNPLDPRYRPLDYVIHDSGDRYTQSERFNLAASPRMQGVASVMKRMLTELDGIFGNRQTYGKVHKYGFLIDGDGKGGMNIPDLIIRDNNAILVNPFSAIIQGQTEMISATRMMHITAHEFAHNLARNEGAPFTWALSKVLSELSTERQNAYAKDFHRALTEPSGRYAPEIQSLLQEYITARGRADTTVDLLTRSAEGRFAQSPGQEGIPTSAGSDGSRTTSLAKGPNTQTGGGGGVPPGNKPPVPPPGSSGGGNWFQRNLGWGQGATKGGSRTSKDEVNWVKEAMSVPSSVTTTGDLSFPGRQGLTLIATKEFWQAAGKMFKGGLSQAGFDAMNAELAKQPIMARRLNTKTGKMDPGIGEELGLRIYKLASQAGPHAEGIASRWLERGIGKTTKDALGNKTWSPTTGSKMWENTFGIPIRAANRAFLTMLNHLSVNRAQFLMDKARDMSLQGLQSAHSSPTGMGSVRPGLFSRSVDKNQAMDLNPYYNKVLGKEIIDFVNTATGHGPLRTHLLPAKQTEINLEGASKVLSATLFSPGLLARTVRFMNPSTYIMASPFVRKQYLKSALSATAAWYAFTEMAKMAGGDEVQVSNDPTSADFGKVRIGDTRLDPGGGFLQFAVAYSRMYQGGSTSSSTGQFHKFGAGYQAQTSEDMMERFMVNKLNPVMKFAYDVASASEYNPFHVGDRTIQMFVPLIGQDLLEIYKEDPSLLPAMGTAAMFGMGTQIYSKGESVGKIIPPENDWLLKGGGPAPLMPWNQ